MTNEKNHPDSRVKTITTGKDSDWSTAFLKAVEQINSKYLLILMEDYFLLQPPDEDFIKKAVDYMQDHSISCFRLFPRPGPDNITAAINRVEFGEIAVNSDYRVSLQAAIWDIDYIKRVVRPGESAWELEIEGTKRSNQMPDRLLSIAKEEEAPIPYLCTAVVKGYWIKEAVEMCRQYNVPIDFKRRKIEPFYVRRNIRSIIELVELKKNLIERLNLNNS